MEPEFSDFIMQIDDAICPANVADMMNRPFTCTIQKDWLAYYY